MDPFATLGIARRFEVDLSVVEKVHRELSRALHPDRYVGASASERRAALEKAVEVNEAWRTVRDPLRRAEALLELSGAKVEEGREPRPEPEFLLEMLERREELADARQARDLAAVRRLATSVASRGQEVVRSLGAGFTAGETRTLVPLLGQLRFFRRFLDEVSAIEDELAI
ncbi:MAG TPA: Fe-S protein assembly co-chaperone HscB [Polyangiaceae bacterium]|nr:Fe-S protein assembly co-chaperone HscB [Polyangiaceae bacterium]